VRLLRVDDILHETWTLPRRLDPAVVSWLKIMASLDRILDREAVRLALTDLGFEGSALERFRHALKQPYGMILITGPTGSGKTTTLWKRRLTSRA